LGGKPVIIGGSEMQRGVVHTASYEARSRGVKMGMSLAKAKQICPQATFLKGNYQHYRAASMTLQEMYLNHTPLVEFTSLDDAYLDMTGMHHLYQDMGEEARRIQQEVKDALHIGVSIGFGTSKTIARIASGLNKPHGVTIVPSGEEKRFLGPLPVDKLPGVGRTTKEKLTNLKIFTISRLAALPAAVMTELFGTNGRSNCRLPTACISPSRRYCNRARKYHVFYPAASCGKRIYHLSLRYVFH
jgi:DNA polymerase-4